MSIYCQRLLKIQFIDNSERLDIIMRWAEDKGVPKEKVKQIVKGVPAEKLIWENNKNAILKKLSNELFLKEYTKRKTDFQEVFFNNKRIDWKGSPESWVYLMYSLTRSPYAYMKTSKGVKPYLIISRQFFKFYNDEEKNMKKVPCQQCFTISLSDPKVNMGKRGLA